MKKRLVAMLFAMIMLITVLTGCTDNGDDTEETSATGKTMQKVVLNEVAHSIFYAPMYVAIEEGYFEEEGIDLELVTGFGALNLGKDTL